MAKSSGNIPGFGGSRSTMAAFGRSHSFHLSMR
jgi:hypothetical protein